MGGWDGCPATQSVIHNPSIPSYDVQASDKPRTERRRKEASVARYQVCLDW